MKSRFGVFAVVLSATACGNQDQGQGAEPSTFPTGQPTATGPMYTMPPPGLGGPGAGGAAGVPVNGQGGIIGAGGIPVGTAGFVSGPGGDPGWGGDPGVAGSGTAGTPSMAGAPGAGGKPPMAMDECHLNSGYPGDENCILPPPPDMGFQLHIGPSNYTTPEAAYILQPGQEATTDFPATASNATDVNFFYRQYRLRPSAHHVIITTSNGQISTTGRRIGTANRSEDYPAGVIAPEDVGVGIPLAAHAPISVSFHAINVTGKPALRELWVNFWYKPPGTVTETATEWFEVGDPLISIPPHTQTTLGPYTCTVRNNGRMLWLYGHRHANNTRFTVTRIRGAQRDVIYDANKWEEPLLLEYASNVANPAPNVPTQEGGWSGILDLVAGDRIEWSCDVNNTQNTTLRFTNETYLGEMCIVDAEAVGSTCQ